MYDFIVDAFLIALVVSIVFEGAANLLQACKRPDETIL